MLKSIWLIFQKECGRFFRDRRTIFMVIILPAVMIYSIYGLMGSSLSAVLEQNYQCTVQNMPESFRPVFQEAGFEITSTTDAEAAKKDLEQGQTDLLVIFPEDFESEPAENVPNILVYYNSGSGESGLAYDLFTGIAQTAEDSLANVWDINRDLENPDVAKTSMLVTYSLPAMIMMLLFLGCQSLGPESIAGEKERGTIATLLVTPISRTAIAIGKVGSLCLLALLAALSSFAGLLLSLPELYGDSFNMSAYGTDTYGWLLCVLITTVLLVAAAFSVLSAVAKTVKEATASATVVYILGALAGMLPQVADIQGTGWYFVPVLNCSLCLNDIFALNITPAHMLITCITNLVYMVGLVALLSKMFNSEKIMFDK